MNLAKHIPAMLIIIYLLGHTFDFYGVFFNVVLCIHSSIITKFV